MPIVVVETQQTVKNSELLNSALEIADEVEISRAC